MRHWFFCRARRGFVAQNFMINIYITILPVIVAGVLNMLFTKTMLYKALAKPIDLAKTCKDGRHIFGKNKTYIGFFSMVVFACFAQVIWGALCSVGGFESRNELYKLYNNAFLYNLLVGALFGFLYMICELPNSFIKRRIGIKPGKTDKSVVGFVFFIIDQFDSVIGIGAAIYFLCEINLAQTFVYIFVGGFTHVAVNSILLLLKVRKNL